MMNLWILAIPCNYIVILCGLIKTELHEELDKIPMLKGQLQWKFLLPRSDGIIHIFILSKMLKRQFHKNHDQPQ